MSMDVAILKMSNILFVHSPNTGISINLTTETRDVREPQSNSIQDIIRQVYVCSIILTIHGTTSCMMAYASSWVLSDAKKKLLDDLLRRCQEALEAPVTGVMSI